MGRNAEPGRNDRAHAVLSARAARTGERLYALAFLGAHLSFMPLLVLLLPRRVAAIASDPVVSLSWLLLLGGLTASLGNIAAGHWSDRWLVRHGSRRGLVALGSCATVIALAGFAAARSVPGLAVAVVAFQLALNLMFAPLTALLADYVEHGRKGRVSGMLNAALPLSNVGIAGLAWLYPDDSDGAFLIATLVVAACIAPLALFWPFGRAVEPGTAEDAASGALSAPRADFARAWMARLLIQLGAAVLINYLFLFVVGLVPRLGPPPTGDVSRYVGLLALVAMAAAFLAALAGGRASDRWGVRRVPLAISAIGAAAALVAHTFIGDWWLLVAAYALFNAALTAFLAIDAALVAQLLAGYPRRGAMLGVMNLTNTLPSVIGPIVALIYVSMAPISQILAGLMLAAALAALVAAALVMAIRSQR